MTHDSKVMSDVILKISNLDVQVPGRTLIKQLNWQVRRGERWCLIGRNGAGKSTLLRIIAGVQAHQSTGSITWNDLSISNYSSEQLAQVRAYAEQFPVGVHGIRAIDVVLAARFPWQADKVNESAHLEIAMQALLSCDVEHLAQAEWQTMSGGERQRVALAACFAQNTQALILDEPTSHLDVGHQVTLLQTLIERSQACGQTIIASLHEIALIHRGFTHALLLMCDGSYLAGPLSEVVNPINLEQSLGHPIEQAHSKSGQTIYIPV